MCPSLKSNYPYEPEFQQAYEELYNAIHGSKLFEKHPEYKKVIPVLSIPERVIQFRVVWEDDNGNLQVNHGYRVQFNSSLGPYKGGIRFHHSVNLSILKFLGFEQIFKNALTGLNMGGGKGGSDFDPKGKSDSEIRRFCYAFMSELQRHIGADIDVPAGDIGVGEREIGYLFGAFKKLKNKWEGFITGKGLSWGGSLIRPEATGYGLVYFVEKMIEYATSGKEGLKGKRVAISGSGNVAQYAALKVMELGGIVISLSDSKGCLLLNDNYSDGFTPFHIHQVSNLKLNRKSLVSIYPSSIFPDTNFTYIENARPWVHLKNVDIVLPCATENEISFEDANSLLCAGVKYLAEGSNMSCTPKAIQVFENDRINNPTGIWYAPGKAANAGGVAVSGLEMIQNSQRISWTKEEVDKKLKEIMVNCFNTCVKTTLEYSLEKKVRLPSLVKGANISGFLKIAAVMKEHGDFW